jgi:hypothetical protein
MNGLPNYLFHVPGKDVITLEVLQKRMGTRKQPDMVDIIDNHTHKRMGRMDVHLALVKFK